MVAGSFFSILGGIVLPFWGYATAKILGIMVNVNITDKDEFREDVNFWCLMLLV